MILPGRPHKSVAEAWEYYRGRCLAKASPETTARVKRIFYAGAISVWNVLYNGDVGVAETVCNELDLYNADAVAGGMIDQTRVN